MKIMIVKSKRKSHYSRILNALVDIVMHVPCVLFLHRWKYFQKEKQVKVLDDTVSMDFTHRKCKTCGLKMYRDKLPPARYEWEHWHYV